LFCRFCSARRDALRSHPRTGQVARESVSASLERRRRCMHSSCA
jgi:hypothetical protein